MFMACHHGHHVFCFKCLCWVFGWNKKSSDLDTSTEFFTFYFEKSVYIVYDVLTPLFRIKPHPMTNQPSRGDDSSLRETFKVLLSPWLPIIYANCLFNRLAKILRNMYKTSQTQSKSPPRQPGRTSAVFFLFINEINNTGCKWLCYGT